MKLICSPINLTVDLCYDKLNIIVIENIYGFRSFVNEMNLASLSEQSSVSILDGAKALNLSKSLFFVQSPYLININDKRFLKAAYDQLSCEFNNDSVLQMKFNELNSELESLLYDLLLKSDFNLTIDGGLDLHSVLKSFGVKIEDIDESLVEKLIDFVSLVSKLKIATPVIAFLNLQQFLDQQELKSLQDHSMSLNVMLLLLESRQICYNENVNLTLLDSDLCVI